MHVAVGEDGIGDKEGVGADDGILLRCEGSSGVGVFIRPPATIAGRSDAGGIEEVIGIGVLEINPGHPKAMHGLDLPSVFGAEGGEGGAIDRKEIILAGELVDVGGTVSVVAVNDREFASGGVGDSADVEGRDVDVGEVGTVIGRNVPFHIVVIDRWRSSGAIIEQAEDRTPSIGLRRKILGEWVSARGASVVG